MAFLSTAAILDLAPLSASRPASVSEMAFAQASWERLRVTRPWLASVRALSPWCSGRFQSR
jgi:hypothetical protein